jgi:acetyltransferase-like isoleucine patch superfamily enzyme
MAVRAIAAAESWRDERTRPPRRRASLLLRVLTPGFAVSGWAWLRFRACVSPRAEVEAGPLLTLGAGSRIGSFVKLKALDGPVRIGARVDVASGAFLSGGAGGVAIGDDCLIGPNAAVIGSNYRYDDLAVPIREQGTTSKGIRIGRDVWLGAGCCVLDGAEIGDGAIVTPCSVVSGKVPPGAVVAGNPAKVIFTRR